MVTTKCNISRILQISFFEIVKNEKVNRKLQK
jgi:hypothetical protein